METVEVNVEDPAALQEFLVALDHSNHIPYEHSQPLGIRCRVVVHWEGHSLELFAIAAADGLRCTDEPGDLAFQVECFREKLGHDSLPPQPATTPGGDAEPPSSPVSAASPSDPSEEPWPEPGDDFDDNYEEYDEDDASRTKRSVPGKPPHAGGPENNPVLIERKRIEKLAVPHKLKLAAAGDLQQRTLLFRMYGKLVFEALLRNPRLTEMEVARLAKLGTMPSQLLQQIGMRPDWLRSERIRNALLGNPRLPLPIAHRIIATLSRQDLKTMAMRRDLPQGVQAALRARLK